MTYTDPFIQVTFAGSLYDGSDIWSNGFKFPITDPWIYNAADLVTIGEALGTIYRNYFNNPDSLISNRAVLETVKVAYIDIEGKYFEAPGNPFIYDVTDTTGGINVPIAPQLSVVVSLTTDYKRGNAHIGRFYLPVSGVPGNDGRLGETVVNDLVELTRQMVADMNAAVITEGLPTRELAVMSKVGEGTTRFVTGVRVGNVIDTQRRRRNAFIEDYVEATIPTA